jgi:polysaccharide pyruvyl transferase WcaK-like protein
MRVLVENGTYGLWNVGDIVMLQVAVGRVRERFAGAEVDVVTRDAERLAEFVPGANAVGPGDWNALYQRSGMLRRAKRAVRSVGFTLARKMGEQDKEVEKWVREAGSGSRSTWDFVSRLWQADAVIASGGGYVTDDFVADAGRVLRTIGLAQKMGKRTAMFGQGFGPVFDENLKEIAKIVLPGVDVIGVRDNAGSVAFLRGIGVDMGRVVVTGDDAIEAAQAVEVERKDVVGVNLRVAWYSGVGEEIGGKLCAAVGNEARRLGAGVRVVGIGIHEREDDVGRVRGWLGLERDGRGRVTMRGEMAAAGGCRVMVTGSFHAAVFALAQGVPAVGLVANAYYAGKFEGLAGQFGEGLRVVGIEDVAGVARAMGDLWEKGAEMREGLRAAGRRQIEMGRGVYEKFFAGL